MNDEKHLIADMPQKTIIVVGGKILLVRNKALA
ncbi:MAG: hypothetical protein G01um101429_500 [Parcubacteria group bacterium Gr01-1014_29]|nr:MAG: hypothetical protein G01um101429_500 [Parcubacteria group bacterium Gr01-1014_29]